MTYPNTRSHLPTQFEFHHRPSRITSCKKYDVPYLERILTNKENIRKEGPSLPLFNLVHLSQPTLDIPIAFNWKVSTLLLKVCYTKTYKLTRTGSATPLGTQRSAKRFLEVVARTAQKRYVVLSVRVHLEPDKCEKVCWMSEERMLRGTMTNHGPSQINICKWPSLNVAATELIRPSYNFREEGLISKGR